MLAQLLWIVAVMIIMAIACYWLDNLPATWLSADIRKFLRITIIAVGSVWVVLTVFAVLLSLPWLMPPYPGRH